MNIYQVRQQLKTKSIFELDLRVAFYARVSTEKEEQKSSIINQRLFFEDYIAARSPKWINVGGYIDDGISGIHAETREEFQRMVEDARKGKMDLIITKEISRFARNTLDSIQYTRELLSYGVCVWFQNDNINTIDEDSEFRLTIMAGVAQDEIRKLSSRVKFGHERSIKNGVVMGNSHIYGYDKKDGRLTVNEAEAPMIRLIFEKYATGEWSTPALETLLYEMGYRNYKGGRINRGVIQHIIVNPKYKGYYAGGKVKIVDMFTKKQEFLPEEEWIMFKDDGSRVPAIVDEETWEKANYFFRKRSDIIKSHRTSLKKDSNIFTGMIYCANDDAPYWLKMRNKNCFDYYWCCSHRIKNGKNSCNSFNISEQELKTMIAHLIQESASCIDEVIKQYLTIYERIVFGQTEHSNEIRHFEQQAGTIRLKMEKILDYNLAGVISDAEFIRRNSEYENQLLHLKEKISELSKPPESLDSIHSKLNKIALLIKQHEKITADDITRTVVTELFEKIVIKPTGEKKASVKLYLKNDNIYSVEFDRNNKSCSDNIVKKMIEAQERQMAGK